MLGKAIIDLSQRLLTCHFVCELPNEVENVQHPRAKRNWIRDALLFLIKIPSLDKLIKHLDDGADLV